MLIRASFLYFSLVILVLTMMYIFINSGVVMKMKANKSLDTIHMPMVEWKPQGYKAEHPNDNLSEHLDCSAKQAELLGEGHLLTPCLHP